MRLSQTILPVAATGTMASGVAGLTSMRGAEIGSRQLIPQENTFGDQFSLHPIRHEQLAMPANHYHSALTFSACPNPSGLSIGKQATQKAVSSVIRALGSIPGAFGFHIFEWLERKFIYKGYNSNWGASLEQAKQDPEKYLAYVLEKRGKVQSTKEKQAFYDQAKSILSQVEEVRFHSKSGVNHYGWYFPAKPGKPTIILSRGNKNREPLGGLVSRMNFIREGYGLFTYEYPGYGITGGVPSESACCNALEAASDYLAEKKHIPFSEQVAYGISLGTGVTVDIASKRAFKAVVLQTPYTTMPDVVSQVLPLPAWLLPIHEQVPSKFDSLSKIDKITSPLLLLHGTDDTLISPECTNELFEKATTPIKEKYFLPNNGHKMNSDETSQQIDSFLKKY